MSVAAMFGLVLLIVRRDMPSTMSVLTGGRRPEGLCLAPRASRSGFGMERPLPGFPIELDRPAIAPLGLPRRPRRTYCSGPCQTMIEVAELPGIRGVVGRDRLITSRRMGSSTVWWRSQASPNAAAKTPAAAVSPIAGPNLGWLP